MTDKSPNDSLSVEWGRFKAGARGSFAIVALLLIFVLVATTYVFGFWRVTSVFSSYVANEQHGVAHRQ
ncbi:hypothetical protein AUC70_01505 [Methyloceanibacter stevinii]|uniref:Uncharacterized protein n=1 Tax=Methyloceanibacter stevinii TaxID=1774970 RepID=A0A1E3VQN4_9HYPH|nr:hypothetical protein [Methyloceanibacter stevinii]ODR95601.1 hypothetical protein AUC70_01505 [Methyloceanibacter stevinii]